MTKKKVLTMIKKNTLSIVAITAILLVFGLWIGTFFYFQSFENEDRGTFGDMFGTVNSLFSGLAFAGIVITILLQKKELSLQRKELKLTRKEFSLQNDTLQLQRFENTFFNLLKIHHQIVNSIEVFKHQIDSPIANTIYKGRKVFSVKYNEFMKDYINKIEEPNIFNEELYMRYYEEMQVHFGHYFRNLYRMFKLVDKAQLISNPNLRYSEISNFRIRYKYTCIIRSNLSDYELLWLFYNCLSKNGRDKFKPLIIKYTILKNLPFDKLIYMQHKNLIDNKAFKREYIL